MNFYYRLFLILGMLSLCACSDFLNRKPLDVISDDSFWQTESDARAFLDYSYYSDYYSPWWEEIYLEAGSDNAYLPYPWEGNAIRDFTIGVHNSITDFSANYWTYRTIRDSHVFLEKVHEVPGLSEETVDTFSGEAHFFIAMKYWQMYRYHGQVPLIDQVFVNPEDYNIGSAAPEVLKAYIEDQIQMAIDLLPAERNDGRVSKGAAQMIFAEYLMWEERYAEAAAVTKQIIDSGIYALAPNYEDLFHSSTQQGAKQEIIMWREYLTGTSGDWDNFLNYLLLPNGINSGWSSVTPTHDFVETYEAIDGSYPYTTSSLYTEYTKEQIEADDDYLSKDVWNYQIRDPRLKMSIMFQGDYFGNYLYDPLDMDNPGGNKILTNNCTRTGYNLKKYADLDRDNWACDVNWIVYRYAETLFLFAEATNEVSGPTAEAISAINQVRTRAGMPEITAEYISSKEAFREFLRREKRVEFIGEAKRFWDTWRWGKNKLGDPANWMENTLQKDVYTVPYKDEEGVYEPKLVRERRKGSLGDRNYVMPLPQGALDRSSNLNQHPNW
ncbi:RagB/SusD family nutrient uptake outer membrane protein [Persicobacter psychrovividus]|uniref:Membrane protein n=1 Tax=Persicobacter psychrovividus TaxID=387638 RepID=A0ABN6LKQ1_9BACT|nr:membrane protein [Persicobacter psychrovividus]